MNHPFDDLTKVLAQGVSRREVLRQIGDGLAAAMLASLGVAKAGWAAPRSGKQCNDLCRGQFQSAAARRQCVQACRDCPANVEFCTANGSAYCANTVAACGRCGNACPETACFGNARMSQPYCTSNGTCGFSEGYGCLENEVCTDGACVPV